jgi:hypothetical protein
MTSKTFDHQVAGHPEQLTLGENPSQLIKRCNDREASFYANLLQATDGSWKQDFLGILPRVYKVDQEENLVVLENLAYGYDEPCIVDIKLGTVLYHDSATPEKRERMEKVAQETTSGSLGFRVCGMKVCLFTLLIGFYLIISFRGGQVYDLGPGQYRVFDKHYGRGLTADSIQDRFLEDYLQGSQILANKFYLEVDRIISVMEKASVELISSSLLLIYDAKDLSMTNKDSNVTPKITARLIDFAQSTILQQKDKLGGTVGRDERILFGLQNFKLLLHKLARN